MSAERSVQYKSSLLLKFLISVGSVAHPTIYVKWYMISLNLEKVASTARRSGLAIAAVVLSTGALGLPLTGISTAGLAEP